MDRRPTLEARPPILINAVVRTLIPYACREHVIGDLWERYRSPRQFLQDALQTVPFVLASRIRRTSKIGLVTVQAFVLLGGMVVGSGGLRRAIVPLAAALVGLVLRDAYKREIFSLSASQVSRDVAVGVGLALASQILLAVTWPSLLMSLPSVAGAAVSFGLVWLLRLQNPGFGALTQYAWTQPPASLDALVAEVRLFERVTLRAIRMEICAGVGVAGFFLFPLFTSPNWVLRVGFCLASVYGLYVAAVVWRHRPRLMPDGLGMTGSLAFYRGTLERHHVRIRTMWLWYLMPFAPALVLIMVGGALVAAERGRPTWPAGVVLLAAAIIGVAVHRGTVRMAGKLRGRIEALKMAEER